MPAIRIHPGNRQRNSSGIACLLKYIAVTNVFHEGKELFMKTSLRPGKLNHQLSHVTPGHFAGVFLLDEDQDIKRTH